MNDGWMIGVSNELWNGMEPSDRCVMFDGSTGSTGPKHFTYINMPKKCGEKHTHTTRKKKLDGTKNPLTSAIWKCIGIIKGSCEII